MNFLAAFLALLTVTTHAADSTIADSIERLERLQAEQVRIDEQNRKRTEEARIEIKSDPGFEKWKRDRETDYESALAEAARRTGVPLQSKQPEPLDEYRRDLQRNDLKHEASQTRNRSDSGAANPYDEFVERIAPKLRDSAENGQIAPLVGGTGPSPSVTSSESLIFNTAKAMTVGLLTVGFALLIRARPWRWRPSSLSRTSRIFIAGTVLWCIGLQLWGLIWRWESIFRFEEFFVLHVSVPVLWLAVLLAQRWIKNAE